MTARNSDDDDDGPLTEAELNRNAAAADREHRRVLRRLLELLRPLVKTDPLMPAICEHFWWECEESRHLDLSVEFSKLRHEALLHRHGPNHRETRKALDHIEDCKDLLKQQRAEQRQRKSRRH